MQQNCSTRQRRQKAVQHQQQQLHAADGKEERGGRGWGEGGEGGWARAPARSRGVNARISLNRCRPIHVGHSPYEVSVPDRAANPSPARFAVGQVSKSSGTESVAIKSKNPTFLFLPMFALSAELSRL